MEGMVFNHPLESKMTILMVGGRTRHYLKRA